MDRVPKSEKRRKLNIRDRIDKREIFKQAKPAVDVKRGDFLKGKVYNVTEEGAFILTEENYIGYIHTDEQTQTLKKDMTVEGRVTFVRADGRVNISLKPIKEVARVVDAEKILEYLKQRNGSMPFNDASPADVIKSKFGISKSAFKRALGKLFKDGLIEDREGWITLVNKEEL